jgi:hypothetical protein
MGRTYVTNAARVMSGLRETKPLSSMLLRWRALKTTLQMCCVLSRLLGFGGEMKGGEGEGAHRAIFLLAYRNYWGNSEVFGGKFPLTGLDKTLVNVGIKRHILVNGYTKIDI